MSDSDEARENPEVNLDPFAPTLAFVESRGMQLTTLGERPGMRPVEPIDTRADKFVDVEALEKLASFHGLYRPPIEQPEDAYPEHIQEALGNVEAQFILRNLSRTVRDTDPDEPLEVEVVDSGRTNIATALVETRTAKIDRVTLLEEMTPQVVGKHRAFIKTLYDDTPWTKHFSRELKETIEGPLWKYDPDAPSDSESSETGPHDA